MLVGNPFRAQGVKPTLVHNHFKMKIKNHSSSAAISRWPVLWLSNLEDAATEQNVVMASPNS